VRLCCITFVFLLTVTMVMARVPVGAQQSRLIRMNRMIEALDAGKVAITGDTWTWIEQEHEPLALDKLSKAVAAALAKRNAQGQVVLAPFVRIPMEGDQDSRWVIKQVLEMGAMGIIVPQVETAAEALTLVQSMRYPQKTGTKYMVPRGRRGFGGSAPTGWMLKDPNDYFEKYADVWPLNPEGELFLMPQIETREGLKNVRAILGVPGVSGVIIGPSDLNVNLGNGAGPRGKNTEEAIEMVLGTCKAARKYCGMVEGADSGIKKYVEQGARFIFAFTREGATFSPRRNF
jgi:4-hydroxy-2-oxoheptanedioate aldolase